MVTKNLAGWGVDPNTGDLDSRYDENGDITPILLSRLNLASGLPEGGEVAGQWHFWADGGGVLTKENDGTYDYMKAVYDDTRIGDGFCLNSASYFLPTQQSDIYVQFWARKTSGGGSKFVKFFGTDTGSNYANTTFAMDYGNGSLGAVSYGDGTSTTNDTQNKCIAYVDTDNSGRAGSLTRAFVRGGSFEPADWGDGSVWHKFQLRVKQNTGTTAGNEINDGSLIFNIDDVTRVGGTNIYNRHYTNQPFFKIEFLSYAQSGAPFELHMRNVTVSLNGWVT